ncbi:unnamed protein product [Victoria cruziana]
MSSITLNKNSVPGDKSAVVPGGIRIGAPALTTRGFKEAEFTLVADLVHEGVLIALECKNAVGGTKLKDFLEFVGSKEFHLMNRVVDLKAKVESLTSQYPLPGV